MSPLISSPRDLLYRQRSKWLPAVRTRVLPKLVVPFLIVQDLAALALTDEHRPELLLGYEAVCRPTVGALHTWRQPGRLLSTPFILQLICSW